MPVSGPSSNQLPGFLTIPAAVGSPTQTGGVGTAANVQNQRADAVREPGSLSRQAAAGEALYAAALTDGMDWDALARDGSLVANLSVSITAIASLLIQILAEMKKSSKEAGFEEMQTALQTGLDAAKKMEEAAEKKYLSAMVSAGMSMAMGMVQMGMAFGAQNMVNKGAGEGALAAYNAKSQAFQTMGNAAAKFYTAYLDLEAGLSEADAQALRSTAEYQQSVAQLQKDFAAQIGEAISKALAMMAKISDVQHQATNAIYGM